jgi:hypothetical protein
MNKGLFIQKIRGFLKRSYWAGRGAGTPRPKDFVLNCLSGEAQHPAP